MATLTDKAESRFYEILREMDKLDEEFLGDEYLDSDAVDWIACRQAELLEELEEINASRG